MEKWLEQMGVGPQLFDTLVSYGSRIVGVIVILFISLMIARWLKRLVARRLEQIEFDRTLGGFLANMTYWLVVVVAVISCMGIFGVETTSFAAVLGGLSVAVGLALKGTLSNVAAGAMLLIFRPFNVGDSVVVGGSSGTVAELNLFFTNLDTPDGRRIIVPNNEVFGKTIENNTFHETRRCDVVVGVGYDDNIAEARQILIDAISSIEGVLEDPAPAAKLTELGASSVDFSVRAHCKTEDYYSVREKMLEQIKKACDEHGLDLPYPHQVVIHQDAAA